MTKLKIRGTTDESAVPVVVNELTTRLQRGTQIFQGDGLRVGGVSVEERGAPTVRLADLSVAPFRRTGRGYYSSGSRVPAVGTTAGFVLSSVIDPPHMNLAVIDFLQVICGVTVLYGLTGTGVGGGGIGGVFETEKRYQKPNTAGGFADPGLAVVPFLSFQDVSGSVLTYQRLGYTPSGLVTLGDIVLWPGLSFVVLASAIDQALTVTIRGRTFDTAKLSGELFE